MKKIIMILMLMTFGSSIYAQKIKTVEDEFYGTKYYVSSSIKISDIINRTEIEAVLQTLNGKDDIMLVLTITTGGDFYTIDSSHNVIFKFDDGSMLTLNYVSTMPKHNVGSIQGVVFSYYIIEARANITHLEEFKTLTDIRIETSNGYRNIKVKPAVAKRYIKAFNLIKQEIEKNKAEN